MTAMAITSAPPAASTHRQPLARGTPAGPCAGGPVAGGQGHLGRRGLSGSRGRHAALHRIGAGRAETTQAVWPGGVHAHSLGILGGFGLCVGCGFGLRTRRTASTWPTSGSPLSATLGSGL